MSYDGWHTTPQLLWLGFMTDMDPVTSGRRIFALINIGSSGASLIRLWQDQTGSNLAQIGTSKSVSGLIAGTTFALWCPTYTDAYVLVNDNPVLHATCANFSTHGLIAGIIRTAPSNTSDPFSLTIGEVKLLS